MNSKRFFAAAVVAGGLALLATGHADAASSVVIFGGSDGSGVSLTLNGTTVLTPESTGWYNELGLHYAGRENYITGYCSTLNCSIGVNYRSYFVFDFSGVTGPITSAVLSASNPVVLGEGVLTLASLTTPIATLEAGHLDDVATYNDLTGGTPYASVSYSGPTHQDPQEISFNAAGLYAAAAAEGGKFAFSGSSIATPTPEPSTWTMMLVGVGGLGCALRRRRLFIASASNDGLG